MARSSVYNAIFKEMSDDDEINRHSRILFKEISHWGSLVCGP